MGKKVMLRGATSLPLTHPLHNTGGPETLVGPHILVYKYLSYKLSQKNVK